MDFYAYLALFFAIMNYGVFIAILSTKEPVRALPSLAIAAVLTCQLIALLQ